MRLLAWTWGWTRYTTPPEGSFEPALFVFWILAALALGYVVWEFFPHDKDKGGD